jgi:Flp pilus assembly protein TadG
MTARPPERGSILPMTALAGLALLLLAGLVVDGGSRLRAAARADRIAAEAARTAVQSVDTRGRTLRLDPTAAVRSARGYLTEAGVSGTVTVTGPRSVQVTVSVAGHDVILGLVGGGNYIRTGSATARLAVGVTEPDR